MVSLDKYKTELEDFVKSIFNVIIYKKGSDNISHLRLVLIRLLRLNHDEINQCFSKHMNILMNYLLKGKQVEKVQITLNKIFKNSSFMVQNFFEEYLKILSASKNTFLIRLGLKFIANQFNSNNLNLREDKEVIKKIIVKQSSEILVNLTNLGSSDITNKSKRKPNLT